MYRKLFGIVNRLAIVNQWLLPLLLISILTLYLTTLDTGLQPAELRGGDLITHHYAQVEARPSNAPGYPLYTMGGWLWFHSLRTLLHAVGISSPNPIPLLSSYSTLWAMVALWLLYAILRKVTRTPQRPQGDSLLATLLTVFYAVTYFFWYYATTTEQYTSAVAQTLAIVYLYLGWRETLHSDNPANGNRLLIALSFLCGLSLAHMLTVALIVPPLVFAILWESPSLLRRVWLILACIGSAILPLASYAYVYLRGAAHPEWWGNGNWQNASAWFWAFVSTAQGREELGWGLEPGRAFFGGQFPALIWQELSLPFLIFGILGIWFLGRYVAGTLYGTLSLYLIFCWMYRFGNWYQVILPIYPLLLVGWVAPLAFLEGRSDPTQPFKQRRWATLLLILAILWRFTGSFVLADSSWRTGDSALDHAALLLSQPLPAASSLFAAVDDTLALQYLIDIWQLRPDLQTVSSSQSAEVLQKGTPLFATWEALATLRSELPALPYTLHTQSVDWVELRLETGQPPLQNETLQKIKTPRHQSIQDGVSFEGYNAAPAPSGAPVTNTPPAMDVTLFWQLATGRWPQGLSISVRPMNNGNYLKTPEDNGILQFDTPAPMLGLLVNESVSIGEIVADPYRLRLQEGEKVDQIQVILYRSQGNNFEQVAELLLPVGK